LQRKTREGQALHDCSGTTKLIAVSAEVFFIHTRLVHILAAGASVDVGIDVIIIIIAHFSTETEVNQHFGRNGQLNLET
jgi:hypothetical protein